MFSTIFDTECASVVKGVAAGVVSLLEALGGECGCRDDLESGANPARFLVYSRFFRMNSFSGE